MRRTYVPHDFAPAALAIIREADEICREYARQGYDLTLRQLYYQFVSRDRIANKQSEYKRLGSIINDARLAGRLDWSHLVDRTRDLDTLPHWVTPGGVISSAAHSYHVDLWEGQPKRMEVWVEKDALAGVLQGPCYDLDVPLFSCRGYTSQSEMWASAQRIGALIADEGVEDVVILHLGDHDPSGIDMTRDIRDRLKLFLRGDWLEESDDSVPAIAEFVEFDWPESGAGSSDDTWQEHGPDWEQWPAAGRRALMEHLDDYVETFADRLTVRRIALTREQIDLYNPPPNPAKITDSRAGPYIAEHGPQSWELDALAPNVLDALVRDHINQELDRTTWNRAVARQERQRELLTKAADQWDDVVDFLERES